MKKFLQKYILKLLVLGLSFSMVTASAQDGVSCVNASGVSGTFSGGICIANSSGTGDAQAQDGFNSQREVANDADLGVITNLIKQVQNIVASLVPLAIGIAVVWFMYNLIKYFIKGDQPAEKQTALEGMLKGLAALFVMVSVWGIIKFLNAATGINQGGGADLPSIPTYQ